MHSPTASQKTVIEEFLLPPSALQRKENQNLNQY